MFAARPVFRSVSHIKHQPNLRPFSALAANPSSKTQVYISNSRSPYINLSIEHHLLQTTPSDSNILFLYTNRPSIVIGRNQNPWLEVNLPLLQSLDRSRDAIDLVRRRSGGGTVFHDEGNVNYSVICPPANFDRDKHAEMVCRALHKLGVPDIAVNCRHDIVMTTPSATPIPLSSCTGKPLANAENTYKISGSAYKLTRLRSLHHGTCLLSSPNLPRIGSFLRSPAEPFIKARGVESVRSRIRNVGVEDTKKFEEAVVEEFGKMYGAFDVEARLGEEAGQVESSREWIYGQTPLFTFSTHPSEEDDRERPELPGKFKLSFESRHGLIQQFALEGLSSAQPQTLSESMINSQIWEIDDWTRRLRDGGLDAGDASTVGPWLNSLLGTRQV
ncbi:putative lipoate-protein ligase A [Colletotrichum siamense]|uniref:Putative lipoate-protein ligase A n=1 Tax=Colletotrichum siamense TaxID=690259 RepID=A0A9P5ETU5_COLSI|nr:putative lipoate-protein ligase A [Colletotrichum siamense]KAF4859361.1 putative lipoate-protein ligase A [Colletotrichum siamense]